jgi:hypothetical protein
MSRIPRRWTAAFGVLAILFAQLVVSAHACAIGAAPSAMSAPAPSHDAGCDRMDAAQRALCERHCHDEAQSQSSPQPAAADFVPAYVVRVTFGAIARITPPRAEPSLAHATAPPAPIRNCRLLI